MQKSSQSATFAVYLFMFSLYSTLRTNNRKAVCYYSRFNCISGLILRIHISSFVIFGIPDGSYHTLQILLRLLVLWHHSKVAFSMTKTNDESYPFNFEKSWNLFFFFSFAIGFLIIRRVSRVKEVERPQVRKGPMSYNPGDFESQLAVDRPTKWNYGTLSEKIDLFCQWVSEKESAWVSVLAASRWCANHSQYLKIVSTQPGTGIQGAYTTPTG